MKPFARINLSSVALRRLIFVSSLALAAAELRLKTILDKAEFWEAHALDELTANQRTMCCYSCAL